MFKVCHYYFQSHSVCASSLLSWGGGDFGQSFHKLYILAMCLHGNREAGWLGVPLFVAEVNWTIGLYGVCVVTEMPMDIITLDTWAP